MTDKDHFDAEVESPMEMDRIIESLRAELNRVDETLLRAAIPDKELRQQLTESQANELRMRRQFEGANARVTELEVECEALRNGLAIAQNSDEHNFQRRQRDAEQLSKCQAERDEYGRLNGLEFDARCRAEVALANLQAKYDELISQIEGLEPVAWIVHDGEIWFGAKTCPYPNEIGFPLYDLRGIKTK